MRYLTEEDELEYPEEFTEPELLPALVKTVGQGLSFFASFCKKHGLPFEGFNHAFKFRLGSKDEVLKLIQSIPLPERIRWYDCDGRKLFETRGLCGGVTSSYTCYLICKGD